MKLKMSPMSIKISNVVAAVTLMFLTMMILQTQLSYGQSIAVSPGPEGYSPGHGM